jgi:hypothetical protein
MKAPERTTAEAFPRYVGGEVLADSTPLKWPGLFARRYRSNPEVEGIPSSAVLEFIRAVEQHVHPMDAVQGFILLRHGNVAAEGWRTPYGPQCPHPLQSLSKSFISTAIGLAVQEGLLTVDDAVLKFFPDDAPANPSENLKALRVRHLLSMNTGHKTDTTEHVYRHLYQISPFGPWLHQKEYTARHGPEDREDNWPKVFLSLPVEYKPGTWFVYNLPLPNGQPSSPKSNQWSGKTYKLDTNHLKLESVAITFNHERSTLSLRDERGGHPIQVGYGSWSKETTNLRGQDNEPIAAFDKHIT